MAMKTMMVMVTKAMSDGAGDDDGRSRGIYVSL